MKLRNKIILTKERMIILSIGLIILIMGAAYRFSPDLQLSPVSDKMKRMVKYQERLKKISELDDRSIFLTSHVERLAGFLISADSKELAGAKIQGMMRDMSGQENISFRSIKTMKPDEKSYENIAVIPVQLTFQATIRQLKGFMYQIESSAKVLNVSELRIIRPSDENKEELNIIMTVQGFLEEKG